MNGTLALSRGREYVQRYSGWAIKVSSALLDQAFFSGSNFIINVLLARWLSPNEYGAFVVAYTWFLLAQNLYDGILVEPMGVFGAGKYASRLRSYLKYLLYAHIAVGALVFVVLGLGAAVQHYLSSTTLFAALLGAAISAPFMLMRWLTRQPFYVISKPHLVVLSGVIYTMLTAGGLWALHQVTSAEIDPFLCASGLGMNVCNSDFAMGQTTVFWAQIILAVSALLPSLYNIWLLARNIGPDDPTQPALRVRQVLTDHFQFGKWSVPSRFMLWSSGQLQYLALPLLFGLAGTANLRALNNLVLPIYLSIGAIGSILMPTFVRVVTAGGKELLNQKVRVTALICVAVCSLYCLVIVLFGYSLMHLVYNSKYNEVATLPNLFFLSAAPLFGVLGVIYSVALKALERFKESVQFNIVSAIFTVTVGLLLTLWFGILGATLAAFLSQLLALLVVIRAYYWSPSRPLNQKAQPSE